MKTAMAEDMERYPGEWDQDHSGTGGGPSLLSPEEMEIYRKQKVQVLRKSMDNLMATEADP